MMNTTCATPLRQTCRRREIRSLAAAARPSIPVIPRAAEGHPSVYCACPFHSGRALRAAAYFKPILRNVSLERVQSTSSPRVMFIVGFPGVTIEDVRFSDCIFRGVSAAEVMNHAGSVTFKNVAIEPAKKSGSLNSPQTAP